ncbi:uncharacterized protein GIQ15_05578 [Arthroderma uncinatum]|uniref:uncharacterized protein n=1 Tax=Arthroderma uncinatum TaxID=74035 RepID=UPI00144AB0F3|nr:uncharacterized protein GIQ15_05578 [Arthroderma uncinatum]KAF3480231.1 hypothetical protein GIQ15_05578 [Arthroderma uncinatum]
MPVPLGQDKGSAKKDHSTSGPHGKSNVNDPLSSPSTITTTTTSESRNTSQTPTVLGPGLMTQAEVDRLYEERMEEEYAKREGGA